MKHPTCPSEVGTDILDSFIDEVGALKKAKDLLYKVYLNIDPEQTKRDIQDYFGFDDSE